MEKVPPSKMRLGNGFDHHRMLKSRKLYTATHIRPLTELRTNRAATTEISLCVGSRIPVSDKTHFIKNVADIVVNSITNFKKNAHLLITQQVLWLFINHMLRKVAVKFPAR